MNSTQEPSTEPALPALLLVEDDPVSRGFLQAALSALPAQVLIAATAAEALVVADTTRAVLWLIDAHLPDASGIELLHRLRLSDPSTPALAHTAETSPALHTRLRDAGFAAVLTKPIALLTLHAAVRDVLDARDGDAHESGAGAGAQVYANARTTRAPVPEVSSLRSEDPVPSRPAAALPIWDDVAALRALNGNAGIVAGMRMLFRTELGQTLPRTAKLYETGDLDALRGELHKLKAATAFVGAAELAAAVGAMTNTLQDAEAYPAFVAAAERLLQSS